MQYPGTLFSSCRASQCGSDHNMIQRNGEYICSLTLCRLIYFKLEHIYNYFSFTSLGDETLDTRIDATFQYQLKHLRPKSRCFMTLHKLYQKWQTWWIATHFLLHNSSYATLCSEALDLVEQPGNGNNKITWDVPPDIGTANAEPRESFMILALRLSEGSPLGVSLTLPRAVKAFNAAWSESCKTKHHLTMRYFRHHVDDA